MSSNDTAEKKFETYFEREIRRPGADLVDLQYVCETFKGIFDKYKLDLFKTFQSEEEHPFRKTLTQKWSLPAETIKTNTTLNCDDIFFLYSFLN